MHIHGSQVKTLSLQISYDAKLNNATYDALKAFQLNTINNDISDLSNSKLRDIEASANTFFNSIASNFNMAGYNQEVLTDYVPALVYTMYDGYYIYSPYHNTLDSKNANKVYDKTGKQLNSKSDAEILNEHNQEATYKHGERLSGMKPYIYYSCRYQFKNHDFVITYSLDNYITIQGIIDGEWKYDQGYLLDNIEKISDTSFRYRGIEVTSELASEFIRKDESYPYIKLNGVKYYQDKNGSCFSILNGEKYAQEKLNFSISPPAIQYYKEAYEFTNRVLNEYGLKDLNSSDAVDEKGNRITLGSGDYLIFDRKQGQSIEDPDSNFNQQRLEVIRYSIEKNLPIAIANYNNYSQATADFQMPKLKEDEWDKIVNNISIISFLQGLNIGGKIYNGYSIITNNKNQEVVSEDSIYIVTNDNKYHRANDSDLVGNENISKGVFNIDFERKSIVDSNSGQTEYFFPNTATGCYSSIVTQTDVNATDNLYQYMQEKGGKLAQVYFTALGRERYGMYRTNVNPETLKAKFK